MHGTLFTLAIVPLKEHEITRTAFIVSKQIAARATERNRIRRRFKEAFRMCMPLHTPCLLGFFPNKRAPEASMEEIVCDVEEVVRTALSRYTEET